MNQIRQDLEASGAGIFKNLEILLKNMKVIVALNFMEEEEIFLISFFGHSDVVSVMGGEYF